jgi:hypothetical protein
LFVAAFFVKSRYGADSIRCTVFADGLSLDGQEFRPWHDKAAQAFVKDVVDGYFPAEFRELYPDGVGRRGRRQR